MCRLVTQVTEIGCHSAGGAPGQSGAGQYRTGPGAHHPATQPADAVGQLDVFVDGDVGESTGREVHVTAHAHVRPVDVAVTVDEVVALVPGEEELWW